MYISQKSRYWPTILTVVELLYACRQRDGWNSRSPPIMKGRLVSMWHLAETGATLSEKREIVGLMLLKPASRTPHNSKPTIRTKFNQNWPGQWAGSKIRTWPAQVTQSGQTGWRSARQGMFVRTWWRRSTRRTGRCVPTYEYEHIGWCPTCLNLWRKPVDRPAGVSEFKLL